MTDAAAIKPTFPPRKKLTVKPKRWSHQDELSALIGKEVDIIALDGKHLSARILQADQFTLKIAPTTTRTVTNTIIFKSSIARIDFHPSI